MAAKPMSKTKVVSHIAEKCATPKKTAVLFFDELFKLAVKECKGPAGKFVIPNIGRAVKAQGTHGPHPANRRGHQDQGQDGRALARGEGVQRRHSEVVFAAGSVGSKNSAAIESCRKGYDAAKVRWRQVPGRCLS